MSPILAVIRQQGNQDGIFASLPNLLNEQASEHTLGTLRINSQWQRHKKAIDDLLRDEPIQALQALSRLIDTLDQYAPTLKGLQEAHKYAVESLETIVFGDHPLRQPAAFLYGHVLAMSPLTAEAVPLTIENLLLSGASDLAMCLILGVKAGSATLFDSHLTTLLRQIQLTAFNDKYIDITQDALKQTMTLYGVSDQSSNEHILKATHTLLAAALQLCDRLSGLRWVCFIIKNMPMLLRIDLKKRFPMTCDSTPIILTLIRSSSRHAGELCETLPIIATWDTARFCASGHAGEIIDWMMALPPCNESFEGLGRMAMVMLDKFVPYISRVCDAALAVLRADDLTMHRSAQKLLGRIVVAVGPITLDIMLLYLQLPPALLLRDVGLLQTMASLLPNTRKKVVQVMIEAIEDAKAHGGESAVLAALTMFPLTDEYLAQRAREFVLLSLAENNTQSQVLLALQLAIEPCIATGETARVLTYKAAQLLLADDPHVVHMALSALSNPVLANSLDEKSCQMILLALHQSLEPSIQIVAAKLLTHLSTGHRAIVQPLAWSHIRQSLSLMDFLQNIDPSRAIVEACIVSNLLPALPISIQAKYIQPVKRLILKGLEHTHESHILSLIFQGLANLAKLGNWQKTQQSQLALDLLEMSQEIPKDSQHAALNAIARLLAAPQHRTDMYEMLLTVHSTFRRVAKLDTDSKALVACIYGHLGTIERNPVISRDSKAAIERESAAYQGRLILRSQVAEARDKSGAARHVNWLVCKSLEGTRASQEVLESMTCFGILQPGSVTSLIPDLPAKMIQEIHATLDRKIRPHAMILFLAACLHASPEWLSQYWTESANLMSRCIAEGEVLSVLRSVDVVLQACG